MSATLRMAAFGGVIVVLALGGFALSKVKAPERTVFLGIDGDPRMRLCDSPANARLASPSVIAALGLGGPLVKGPGQSAAYRISVLRPAGQESLSVTFATGSEDSRGARKANPVTVRTSNGGPVSEVDVALDYAQAADLVYALQGAGIWGELRPTIESLVRAGEASAVVEVRAPRHDRCVTTRYDDERVRPMLAVFAKRIEEAKPDLVMDALVSPERSFLATKAARP